VLVGEPIAAADLEAVPVIVGETVDPADREAIAEAERDTETSDCVGVDD
jgi:hypothetical protein